MVQEKAHPPASATKDSAYRIQVLGELDERWSDWFNGIEIATAHSRDPVRLSTLTCPAIDQAKLRGILLKIWDMNLILVSVTRIPERAGEEEPPQGPEGAE